MRGTPRDGSQHDVPAEGVHVVIVGAGFGGLEAARALKGAPVQVTVIDQTNHHVFQPLLYQVATAALSPADISAPIRSVLRHQANAEVLMGTVTGVDAGRRVVCLGSREVPYDVLILATGAGQSYFGHDEWARFAPGLKTTSDATAIRQQILLAFEAAEMEPDPRTRRALMTFVVVGGGPTGVELTGAIAELARKALPADFRHIDASSAQVVLVEAQARILPTFSARLARHAEETLRRLGVTVRTASSVESVDAEGVIIGGRRLAARTVIWAACVRASPVGAWLDAATDRAGRVLVEGDLSVPAHPEVFVVGDAASAVVAPSEAERLRYVAIAQFEKARTQMSQASHHAAPKITTKTGDTGMTGVLGPERLPKEDPRIEALGAIDEATSALGLARAWCYDPLVTMVLVRVQRDLYTLMAELATTTKRQKAIGMRIIAEDVAWLERTQESQRTRVEIAPRFILPGDTHGGAMLDFARSVVRRAERAVSRLYHAGELRDGEGLRYLNRLSDLLFVLARVADIAVGGSTPARAPRDDGAHQTQSPVEGK